VTVLDRQRGRLHASLTRLIESHAQWAGALEVTDRQRVAAQTSEIEAGCERLRHTLVELDGVLIVPDPDRDAVRSLAQAIGAQAARCERALRAADRAIREGGHS
jgi:HAMP domain-containing protein